MIRETLKEYLAKLCEKCIPIGTQNNDHRADLFNVIKTLKEEKTEASFSLAQRFFENAQTVVMIIHKRHIKESDEHGKVIIQSKPLYMRTLSNTYSICKSSRYALQPSAFAEGTGFFIEPGIIATAAHVLVKLGYDARDYRFVQGVIKKDKHDLQHGIIVSKEQVWKRSLNQQKIAPHMYELYSKGADWALIHIEPAFNDFRPKDTQSFVRLVQKATPEGDIVLRAPKNGDLLYALGHGLGLPLKVSIQGEVISVFHDHFFESSLTLLGGNSGSPVFFADDDSLAGIYMRGVKKLMLDKSADPKPCFKVKPENEAYEGQECQKLDRLVKALAISFSFLPSF
jgi:hypothetical protein